MTEPLLLSVRQAASTAGIGRDAMYELVRTGKVRSIAIGRRRLIPRLELLAWIERELGGGEDFVESSTGTGKEKAPDLTAAESRA